MTAAAARCLWIVNHHASRPGESASGLRHFLLARELETHGWSCVIIAGGHEHASGKDRIARKHWAATQQIDGVTFRWLRVPAYTARGASRLVAMLAFWARVILPGSTRGLPAPDAVIGSSVHPLAAHAAARLAARHGVPFYFEIRDLWPETLIQMGALDRDSLPARGLARLEQRLCSIAEQVITTMPFAYEYLETRGVPRERVTWLSNGVVAADFPSTEPPVDAFHFVYFGAFGPANALPELMRSFVEADLEGAHLSLVGQGPERQALTDLARELGASDRVHVLGPVLRSDIPRVAARAHCLVAAVLDLPLYRYGISLNKLFEYMASGRPILFLGRARGNPVIGAAGGVCTDGGRRDNVAGFRAVHDATARQRHVWGTNNRRAVETQFDVRVVASDLSDLLAGARNGAS